VHPLVVAVVVAVAVEAVSVLVVLVVMEAEMVSLNQQQLMEQRTLVAVVAVVDTTQLQTAQAVEEMVVQAL
jgi:hypothetical protein